MRCCADEKVQEQVKLQSLLDLHSITVEGARYATAWPPPFNILGLFWQLFGFAVRYKGVKLHWPKTSIVHRFGLYLKRNHNTFHYRDFHSLDKEDDVTLVEEQSDTSKSQMLKLTMFMENARKDYLLELANQADTRVENLVSHMHETVVQVLECKIEDRIQKIQDKLQQFFPADKADLAQQREEVGADGDEYIVCGYLTDVEANFDYFERYLAISQIVGWSDEDSSFVPKQKKLKFKRDDAIFVYGGDTQDKGIGDIRFTKLLLELRENYPGRVEFLIGNRDANKMRLATELHEDAIKDPKVVNDRSFPYWENEDKRCTPQMFLDKNPPENGGSVNNAANRLRWILEKNMGALGAFERRRHELSILRECGRADICDEDVVQSYRDQVDPRKVPGLQWEEVGSEKPTTGKMVVGQGSAELAARLEKGRLELSAEEYETLGLSGDLSYNSYIHAGDKYFKPRRKDGNNYMLQYLKNAKLAFVFGPNLFVHGALTEDNQGTVPGAREPMRKVVEWVHALNAWAQGQVEAFEKDPYYHEESSDDYNGLYSERKGGDLMDYGVPNGVPNSVISRITVRVCGCVFVCACVCV